MSDKIKVIGYSKREFYQNGIEYRNFSDNLVGNQFTSDGGTTLFTLGNFRVTTNLENRLTKNYKTNSFSKYYSLNKLKLDHDKVLLGYKEEKDIKLNLDRADLSNYAYFGSLVEYVRVSLENIITKWPASLFVNTINQIDPNIPNPTAEQVYYDKSRNKTTFYININHIKNDFDINIKKNGSILNTFNKDNKLRDMNLSYSDYVIDIDGKEYPIIGFEGYGQKTFIKLEVLGDLFGDKVNSNSRVFENFHIKPTNNKINKFFIELNDFEKHLLNRNTTPLYRATFNYTYETDNGITILGEKHVTWPTSDGYNIDFKSGRYIKFVKDLLSIAEKSDDNASNIITNRLVSKSITEFDTIDAKMDKTLKIYGRNLDELKTYIDGIRFINHISYNKKNNVPDRLVKNLARTMGWELTTSLFNVDFNEDFLSTDGVLKLSPVESEIELWRRLILNSPWIWKSKGTRKVIEFLLRFVGAPDGLVSFKEYIYKAKSKIDLEELEEIIIALGREFNLDDYVIDDEGYPKIKVNNGGLYFQKGGQWHRQTAGEESNLDMLRGNNPHIGPYDEGFEYINQFNELVPDFEPVTLTTTKYYETKDQIFLNYDYGKFDKFFDNNVVAKIDLDVDFQTIYSEQFNSCVRDDYDSETCELQTSWTIEAYLDGELISEDSEPFFQGGFNELPTINDYINGLNKSITSTEGDKLIPVETDVDGGYYKLIEELEICEVGSELNNKKVEFRLKMDFEYECEGFESCHNLEIAVVNGVHQLNYPEIVDGSEMHRGLVLFEGDGNIVATKEACTNIGLVPVSSGPGYKCLEKTVAFKECCNDQGFISNVADGGYNCYSQVNLLTLKTEVFVFMDIASLSPNEAMIAKDSIMKLYNRYRELYPQYDPNNEGKIYFIPIKDSRWVNYANKIVSGNIDVHTSGEWSEIAKIPSNLNTPDWVAPKEVVLLAMLDDSEFDYHETDVTLENQPTPQFINDYRIMYDNIENYFDYFKGMVYPIIRNRTSKSGSFILHTLAAIEGTILPYGEVDKIKTHIDISELNVHNPYEGYLIDGDVNNQSYLLPLSRLNWSAIYNREHPAIDVFMDEQFIKDLQNLMIINEDDNIYTVDSTGVDASNDKIRL